MRKLPLPWFSRISGSRRSPRPLGEGLGVRETGMSKQKGMA
jgi:hypothetical protein